MSLRARATVLDIARQAGVSRATVSLVLRGSDRIKPETADKLAAKLRGVVTQQKERYAGTEVTVAKGDHPVVRATVPDSSTQRPGRLFMTDVQLWMSVAEV